jgi:D-amino peptidase
MKEIYSVFCVILLVLTSGPSAAAQKALKVFISVDMEGLAGVVSSSQECGASGLDYQYVRRIMTLEANAAIEGALAAGATDIVVRDGHGSKTNIIPDLLHKRARLLRGVTDKPENMMLGLDESFNAVVFIGYHAKAGTSQGIIAHTSSGNVIDFSVNDVSLPEAGFNAIIAGLRGVHRADWRFR